MASFAFSSRQSGVMNGKERRVIFMKYELPISNGYVDVSASNTYE
jgi:hypothetical protein